MRRGHHRYDRQLEGVSVVCRGRCAADLVSTRLSAAALGQYKIDPYRRDGDTGPCLSLLRAKAYGVLDELYSSTPPSCRILVADQEERVTVGGKHPRAN